MSASSLLLKLQTSLSEKEKTKKRENVKRCSFHSADLLHVGRMELFTESSPGSCLTQAHIMQLLMTLNGATKQNSTEYVQMINSMLICLDRGVVLLFLSFSCAKLVWISLCFFFPSNFYLLVNSPVQYNYQLG